MVKFHFPICSKLVVFAPYTSSTYVSILVVFMTCFRSNNFLKIDVYYGQLKSEEVYQMEAYDVISFFSK